MLSAFGLLLTLFYAEAAIGLLDYGTSAPITNKPLLALLLIRYKFIRDSICAH